jgi:uncharacterized protein
VGEQDAVAKVSRAEILRAELQRFVDIVAADTRTQQVRIFGSAADATIDEWSDLDVVVVMETELPFLERLRYLQRLARPQVAMDLLVYTPDEWAEIIETRPFVRDEIVAKGLIVYDRSVAALA